MAQQCLIRVNSSQKMDTKLRNLIIIIAIALVAVGGLLYVLSLFGSKPTNPADPNKVEGFMTLQQLADRTKCLVPAEGSNLDDFAKCIKDSGAAFYGAFWCPHCKDQKALFGDSAQYLPYVECSTPDGNSELQVCADRGVTVYPTWKFK